MLSEKMEQLSVLLKTNNKKIAEKAGCSPANFSRLRNGGRCADEESSTVCKYVKGVCSIAREKGIEDRLCELIRCEQDEIESRLRKWLFEYEEDDRKISVTDPAMFGKKLRLLMELAEVSNSRLSKSLNIDASYISRMRQGERVPKSDSGTVSGICSYIFYKMKEEYKTQGLTELLGLSEETDITPENIKEWLYSDRLLTNDITVKQLMDKIENICHTPDNTVTDDEEIKKLIPYELLNDDNSSYRGLEGMRNATLKFLANAVLKKHEELLLYSDQCMDWMTDEFIKTWTVLMTECIRRGIKIKIIHNVDRGVSEMLKAIVSWMPLYASGMIEPYYCVKSRGERFSCTIFIDKGYACVRGLCVRGLEDSSNYVYTKSPETFRIVEENYYQLLQNSRPLLKLSDKPAVLSGKYTAYIYNNNQICIGEGEVILNKLTEPMSSFTFDHPMVYKAFKSFIENQ